MTCCSHLSVLPYCYFIFHYHNTNCKIFNYIASFNVSAHSFEHANVAPITQVGMATKLVLLMKVKN
jgi:hypothetical protein